MNNHKGFTLIELLVVIFVFMVVFSFAVLTSKFNVTRELEAYAKQLKSYLTIARDEAVFGQYAVAFVVSNNTVKFYAYSYNNKEWQLLSKKERFWRDKKFPKYIELSLANKDNKILIYPDGELSVFTLRIKNKKNGKTLFLKTQNKIDVYISSEEEMEL